MKISFLTFSVFMLISQFQLIGQNNITNQNKNFEITRIGEHGFCRDGDIFYYKLDVNVKNNTNLKLKRTQFCASINQLMRFRDCNSKIYDSIWHPQSVIKFDMFIRGYYIDKDDFDRTPENILLSININAHNIDIDFDELVSKYNIKDDWKDFQKVLGLRDIEPGEKLKIIKPPVMNPPVTKPDSNQSSWHNSNEILDPNDPLGIIIDEYSNPDNRFIELYKTEKATREIYDKYVKTGIYAPFHSLNIQRRIIHSPYPVYKGYKKGLVIVEVTVNRNGIVTQAKAGIEGSTNTHKKLLESAKNAALQVRFEPNPYAPEYQTNIIKYKF